MTEDNRQSDNSVTLSNQFCGFIGQFCDFVQEESKVTELPNELQSYTAN